MEKKVLGLLLAQTAVWGDQKFASKTTKIFLQGFFNEENHLLYFQTIACQSEVRGVAIKARPNLKTNYMVL